ncbi:MAG: ATP-binding cassette domain-containing protein [Deltaproteobacteria bacterium]|nr:ATP-binding cassette domain-containing protein [Deltaproteobacteria bacterium]
MSVQVRDLTKVYQVPVKQPGLLSTLRSVFHREYREVRAVDRVSFNVEPGERVGFLGPNGAGKTTTLKMLSGLLHPTSGEVRIEGRRPQDRSVDFLKSITLVMGQKQQLIWDLPASDSFELNRALFDIPRQVYRERLDELTALLGLDEFTDQPVRNLSLGQRMRCELAAALLHRPGTLFLDEPTIGLDVEVQAQVRQFIDAYNRNTGATVLLTSHDMEDVAHIAERILLIDHGVVRFDGSLGELQRRFGPGRLLTVKVGRTTEAQEHLLTGVLGMSAGAAASWSKTVAPDEVNAVLTRLLQDLPSAEVSVGEPPLREVLTRAFGEARERREEGA